MCQEIAQIWNQIQEQESKLITLETDYDFLSDLDKLKNTANYAYERYQVRNKLYLLSHRESSVLKDFERHGCPVPPKKYWTSYLQAQESENDRSSEPRGREQVRVNPEVGSRSATGVAEHDREEKVVLEQ